MPATPAQVLAAMLRSDPAGPRVTFYEDSPGPTQGERIELSAKVFTNWVNKAANALQDEWDIAPGSCVRLALPPHWRSLYWALAVWSVGATVVLDDTRADLVVTDDVEVAAASTASSVPTVLVTLAALARGAGAPVPPGAMDEARELATYADQFSPWDEAGPSDAALRDGGTDTAYEGVVPQRDWAQGVRVHTSETGLGSFLATTLAAWAADGSIVLSRGPEGASGRAARLTSEGVTLEV